MRSKITVLRFVSLALAGLFIAGAVTAQTPKTLGDRIEGTKRIVTPTSSITREPEIAPLFIDNFEYSVGSLLTANGWSAHSGGGTNAQTVTVPGLTFAGYPSSGIGNAVSLTTSGEDTNKVFVAQTTGSVYAAVMINVTASQVTGDYFFHLVDGPITGNLFKGRLFVKKDAATTNFAIGIQKSSTANAVYTGFTFVPGTTYLIVIKYTFVAGTTNDTVDLFVNPTLGGAEPAPTSTAVLGADADAVDIRGVAIRQGSAANAATVVVDGIRVGTTWDSTTKAFISKASMDMDGDGRSDYVVARDPNGPTPGAFAQWFISLNSSNTPYQVEWGNPDTDDIDCKDYDGDGKTDIGAWRKDTGTGLTTFYVLLSATNSMYVDQLGLVTDEPASGDYNGDGKADVAVFRNDPGPTNQSLWYYRPTPGAAYVTIALNGEGSRAAGDYDGDGKMDPAIFSTGAGGVGEFRVARSTGGTLIANIGLGTDIVAPGDYDGDGKTDFCVIRASGANWQWEYSSSLAGPGPTVIDTWGIAATDIPAPGDYNGDGKTDYCVFRPSALSEFYVMTPVTRQISVRQWGLLNDFPAAAAQLSNTGF